MPNVSYLKVLEQVDRSEHFQGDGGGHIVCRWYCEPYTAAPQVVLALKGTVVKTASPAVRIKPMQDMLYPHFYCSEVTTEPFAPEAIRGKTTCGYEPINTISDPTTALRQTPATGTNQYGNILKALTSSQFDFDFANNVDIDPADIRTGGEVLPEPTLPTFNAPTPAIAPYTSNGKCGALVTAIFKPLITVDWQGTSSSDWPNRLEPDPFDYINPVFETEVLTTQIGRNLRITPDPNGNVGQFLGFMGSNAASVSDTASVTEQVLKLSITRKMVPYLPSNCLSQFQSMMNYRIFTVGDLVFPPGVVRYENPTIQEQVTVDGQRCYDITLHYTIRLKCDAWWNNQSDDSRTNATSGLGINVGRLDWNHMLCCPLVAIPAVNIPSGQMAYYPVGWWDGWFVGACPYRGLHLPDRVLTAAGGPGSIAPVGWNPGDVAGWGRMDQDPFAVGFEVGQ